MRRIRSADEIYDILEAALAGRTEPVTAPELMELAEVREAAIRRFGGDLQTATNKLSDTLGFMWRRLVLTRFTMPATGAHRARYGYTLSAQPAPGMQEMPPPSSPTPFVKASAEAVPVKITREGDKTVIELRITLVLDLK